MVAYGLDLEMFGASKEPWEWYKEPLFGDFCALGLGFCEQSLRFVNSV